MRKKRVLPTDKSAVFEVAAAIPPKPNQASSREGTFVYEHFSGTGLRRISRPRAISSRISSFFTQCPEKYKPGLLVYPVLRQHPFANEDFQSLIKLTLNKEEKKKPYAVELDHSDGSIMPQLLSLRFGFKDVSLKISLDYIGAVRRRFNVNVLNYFIHLMIHRQWTALAPRERYDIFFQRTLDVYQTSFRNEQIPDTDQRWRIYSRDVWNDQNLGAVTPGKTRLFSFFDDIRVERVLIDRSHPFYEFCRRICRNARIIGNFAVRLMKQAHKEGRRFKNADELAAEVKKQCRCYAEISGAFGQKVVYQIWSQFESWWATLKVYAQHPDRFLGPPGMPHTKRSYRTAVFSRNGFKIEDHRVIFSGFDGMLTDLPQFMCAVDHPFGIKKEDVEVGDFRIVPAGNTFYAELTYKRRDFFVWGFHLDIGSHALKPFKVIRKSVFTDALPDIKDPNRVPRARCSIDLGVENFLTVTPTLPTAPVIIVKGGVLKSILRKANRSVAMLLSSADLAGNAYKEAKAQGLNVRRPKNKKKHIQKVIDARNRAVADYLHKASNLLVRYCLQFEFDDIIIGINRGNKQQAHMGRRNNQNHCQMPHAEFIEKLRYKAAQWRITVTETEESYTSKASALDFDDLPVYKKGAKKRYTFSGTRSLRGLYKRKGQNVQGPRVLNADVNGSLNIARKVIDGQEWLKTLASVNNRGLLERPVVQSPLNTPIWITDPGVVQRLKSQGSSQTP